MIKLPRLLRRDFDIPTSAPVPVSESSIQYLERALEAGRRVEDQFGIRVDSDWTQKILVSVRNQGELFTALGRHNIATFDFDAVRRYQKRRVRRTLREVFSQGWRRILGLVEKVMMHGWTGGISAFATLLVTIPLGIPLLIDSLWYDVAFGWSYAALLLPQLLLLAITTDVAEDKKSTVTIGRLYAHVNFWLIGLPISFLATLIASWFMPGTSGRKWETFSINEFLGGSTLRMEHAIAAHRILDAAPGAKLQFEALVNEDGTRDGEVFLVVDAGDLDDDHLYVWHDRV